MSVKNIMQRNLLAIEEDETIKKFINLCNRFNISEMPVIDKSYRIVGYINENMVIKASLPAYMEYLKNPEFLPECMDVFINLEKIQNESISKYMKKEKFIVNLNDSRMIAAEMMVKNNLKLIPVVDDDKILVGIVRRIDIFKEVIDKKWN